MSNGVQFLFVAMVILSIAINAAEDRDDHADAIIAACTPSTELTTSIGEN